MSRQNFLLAVFISGIFMMEIFDGAMIATLLPTIARDFGLAPVQAQAVLTIYFLTLAALIPLSNWLLNRFGPRRLLIIALVVFALGSYLFAVLPTFEGLVAARFVLGVGGAMTFPVGRMIIVQLVPKQDLVRATTFLTIPSAAVPLIAPMLAGYVATFSDWRLLFFINVPISCVAIIFAFFLVPRDTKTVRRPFDAKGMALSTIGLASVGYGLHGMTGLKFDSMSLSFLTVGFILVLCYIWYARHATSPILELSLFRYRTFKIATTGSFVTRAVVVGALPFLIPMMLQIGFGLTAFQSGSITFVGAIAVLMTKFFIGPMLRFLGFKSFLSWVAVLGALFMLSLALVDETTSPIIITSIIFLGTLFRVLQILGLESMIFSEVPQAEIAEASCLLSVTKQLAAYGGVCLSAVALQVGQLMPLEQLGRAGNFQMAIVFMAVPLALTSLLSLRLTPEDGAEISGRNLARKRG